MNSFCRVGIIVCLLSMIQVPAGHAQSTAEDFVIGL